MSDQSPANFSIKIGKWARSYYPAPDVTEAIDIIARSIIADAAYQAEDNLERDVDGAVDYYHGKRLNEHDWESILRRVREIANGLNPGSLYDAAHSHLANRAGDNDE